MPRSWAQLYRRAAVVLGAFQESAAARSKRPPTADVLDAEIRTTKTSEEVRASSSPISRRWGIVTGLQPPDVSTALKAARADHGRLFREVDARWTWPAPARVPLRLIGSTALMLQTAYRRGTKDSDLLETIDLSTETPGEPSVANLHRIERDLLAVPETELELPGWV